MASWQALPSFETASQKVEQGCYSSARKTPNSSGYWSVIGLEGKKLSLALRSTLLPENRLSFSLCNIHVRRRYDCTGYRSLVGKSVAGFPRPIQFRWTGPRPCPLKAYQDKCHQGKHTAAVTVNLAVTASPTHPLFSISLLLIHASSFTSSPILARTVIYHLFSITLTCSNVTHSPFLSSVNVRTLPSFLLS
jgi:hypothetical protein